MTAEPTRIAFCITELDRGGAERALTQLVLGLDRAAWLPRVYCLSARGHFTDVLEAGGVTVECLNGRGLWSFPRVLARLVQALRGFRPALLQTFLFHGNLVGRIAGRLAGVPVIVSGIRVADRRSRWYGRVDRCTNGLAQMNVCVSQGVADFAVRETGLKPSKVCVIPNGVNVDLFAQAQPADMAAVGLRGDLPVITTVGRLEAQKGIGYLLQAASIVLQKHPESQFLIVGDGPDRASLEALALSLSISKSVWFVGARSDVPSLLKASSAFVLPSLWEGMPNALLEAMAAGLPVIATAVEGSREIVLPGVTGWLVSPANSTELAQAILHVLEHPDVADRVSVASEDYVRDNFTEQRVVDAYDRLYRQLMLTR